MLVRLRRMRGSIKVSIAVAAAMSLATGLALAFAVGYFLNLDSSSSSVADGPTHSYDNEVAPIAASMPSCDEVEPQPIAFVGRLAPAHVLNDLLARGYVAKQAMDGFDDSLIVLREDPQTVSAAQANPALAVTGWIRARSMDLSLRSCFYRLDDKPAAVEMANRATAWMVQNGVLTRAQIDAGGTTFGLADDPTNSANLFFSVILATPGGGRPGTEAAGSLTRYTAVIDRATGTILGAGKANW